jgi:hypothetical protein
LGAQAQRSPQTIGGGVATANHDRAFAYLERLLHVWREQARVHIAADQKVGRFVNAGEIRSQRVFHLGVDLGSHPDEDGIESFVEQIINSLVFSNVRMMDEPDTCTFELLPFFKPDILGKFEIGDAVHQQATRDWFRFKDRDLVPALDELVSAA